MKLSIVVPVFNEVNTIGNVLQKLLSLKLSCEKEIIIVNDGSTDGTHKEIRKHVTPRNKNILRVVTHPANKGKGSAIRTGMKNISGDYMLIQDADLEYNPDEIPFLIQALGSRKTSSPEIAVYGSRFMGKERKIPFIYLIGNKTLTLITRILFRVRITDMETGYKLLPKKFFTTVSLVSDHFDIEPEITAKLVKKGIPIKEVSISYSGRSHLAGKKLTPMDAFEAIRALLYYRFFN